MRTRSWERIALAVTCVTVGAVLYLKPQTYDTPVGMQMPASAPSSEPDSRVGGRPRAASSSPRLHDDRTLPTPVAGLRLASNTGHDFVVAWSASYDAAGIRHYVVLVDGQLVARPTQPQVTLMWPADMANILVQVAAVDNNGNQGEWRAIVVIPPPFPVPGESRSGPTSGPEVPAFPSPGATPPPHTSWSPSPSASPVDPTSFPPSIPPSSESPSPLPSSPPSSASPEPTPSASPTCQPGPTPPDVTVTATATPVPTHEPSLPGTSGPRAEPSPC